MLHAHRKATVGLNPGEQTLNVQITFIFCRHAEAIGKGNDEKDEEEDPFHRGRKCMFLPRGAQCDEVPGAAPSPEIHSSAPL